jgi:hypothetical protein
MWGDEGESFRMPHPIGTSAPRSGGTRGRKSRVEISRACGLFARIASGGAGETGRSFGNRGSTHACPLSPSVRWQSPGLGWCDTPRSSRSRLPVRVSPAGRFGSGSSAYTRQRGSMSSYPGPVQWVFRVYPAAGPGPGVSAGRVQIEVSAVLCTKEGHISLLFSRWQGSGRDGHQGSGTARFFTLRERKEYWPFL